MNNTNPPGETESSSQPEIIIPVNFAVPAMKLELEAHVCLLA